MDDFEFDMDVYTKSKCPLCDGAFSSRGNLKAHLIRIHKKSVEESKALTSTVEEARYHCKLCDKTCRDRNVHEKSDKHLRNVAKAKARAKSAKQCDRKHVSSGSEEEKSVSEISARKRPVKESATEETSSVVKRKISVNEIPADIPDLVSDDKGQHHINVIMPKPLRKRVMVLSDSSDDEIETISRKSTPRRPPSVEPAGTRPSESEFGEIYTKEKLWKEFKKATAPKVAGKRPKTFQIYRDKLENFEAFIQKNDPSFRLADTCNVGSKTKFRKMPAVNDWAESYETAVSKNQAVNAYKRFVKFLLTLIVRIEDKMPDDMRMERSNFLDLKHKQANDIARASSRNIESEKFTRKRRAALTATQDDNVAPKGDYLQLKSFVEKYRDSDFRKTWYKRCKDEGLKQVIRNYDWSKVDLRNFLMFEMYLESFGQRPDTIRNVTQLEVFNGTRMADNQNVVIDVGLHKTCSTYGVAQIQIPAVLWDLVREFCREIRGMFHPVPDNGEYVFLTTTGKQMEDLNEAIEVFTSVVDPPFKVLPMDFRSMCATLGQTHPELVVRASVPLTMNHSQRTAEKYYLDQGAKRSEHLGLKAKVVGLSENLPDANEKDSEADTRYKEDLNKRDLEESKKADKKRRRRRNR